METETGYLVYKDNAGKEIFDHPKLTALMNFLFVEFSSYKYTIYRCAAKIATLQKVLYTSRIPYKLVIKILERHRINNKDGSTLITPLQLTSIIHDILFACNQLGLFNESTAFDLENATSVLANFIWNVFDPRRSSPVQLLEFKEIFLLLGDTISLEDMIYQYFQLAADHNRCISRFRLESILKVLIKIFNYINEGDSYGTHLLSSMLDECFAHCPGINGINEYQFNCLWNITDTKFQIYANLLALIKRIKDTEKLVHNVPCSGCLSEKIIGIRFKCQVCRKTSLCLKCFSKGFFNKKHQLTHRMYEVFSNDEPASKKWTHFLAKLCNMLSSSNKEESSIRLCEENETELVTLYSTSNSKFDDKSQQKNTDFEDKDSTSTSTKVTDATNSNTNFSQSLLYKLFGIVEVLVEEHQKMQTKVMQNGNNENSSLGEFLIEHKKILANVIDQLKFIVQNTSTIQFPTSSTPNKMNCNKRISDTSSHLSASIHGADINKSYVEANKSDYSINDISTWFNNNKRQSALIRTHKVDRLSILNEDDGSDTQMTNFRDLLSKVKEILEDSYSDNSELAEATQHLENVLDGIIHDEEKRRQV